MATKKYKKKGATKVVNKKKKGRASLRKSSAIVGGRSLTRSTATVSYTHLTLPTTHYV